MRDREEKVRGLGSSTRGLPIGTNEAVSPSGSDLKRGIFVESFASSGDGELLHFDVSLVLHQGIRHLLVAGLRDLVTKSHWQ